MKTTLIIKQEEIENAAEEYVLSRQQARHNAKKEEDATMRDFDKTIKAWDAYDMEQAFESGANIFIGRQEKEVHGMCLSDVKAKIDAWMESHTEEEVYECLKKYNAVEDEDTVIQGWVGRDKDGAVYVHKTKPYRGAGNHGKPEFWVAEAIVELPQNSFPDLTWESDPQPVEIIIKRKKK